MHIVRPPGTRPRVQASEAVSVFAPARLHLGFFDLDGALGRRFGSLGITLDELGTEVTAASAPDLLAEGPGAGRALDTYARIAAALDLPRTTHLTVGRSVPAHSGLGSGTQMALAVGTAATRLAGRSLSPRQIASHLGRGRRSGVGVAAFAEGGVLVDGGCRPGGGIAPVIARLPFPDHWRIILIFDRIRQGVHGTTEEAAFAEPPPFRVAADLCRRVLMQALPALAEADIDGFGAAVGALQRAMGDHFAARQGGRFTSPEVARVLAWFESHGVFGVGQSSWGPTGFAIVGGEEGAAEDSAHALIEAARAAFAGWSGLTFRLCRGRNRGAEVRSVTVRPAPAEAAARFAAVRP